MGDPQGVPGGPWGSKCKESVRFLILLCKNPSKVMSCRQILLWGASGGPWGVPEGSLGGPRRIPGGPWRSLGGFLGDPGGSLGSPGNPQRSKCDTVIKFEASRGPPQEASPKLKKSNLDVGNPEAKNAVRVSIFEVR